MKKSQDLSRIKSRNDIPFGALLMGTTGVMIGVVVDSKMAMIVVGVLGALSRRISRLGRWKNFFAHYLFRCVDRGIFRLPHGGSGYSHYSFRNWRSYCRIHRSTGFTFF